MPNASKACKTIINIPGLGFFSGIAEKLVPQKAWDDIDRNKTEILEIIEDKLEDADYEIFKDSLDDHKITPIIKYIKNNPKTCDKISEAIEIITGSIKKNVTKNNTYNDYGRSRNIKNDRKTLNKSNSQEQVQTNISTQKSNVLRQNGNRQNTGNTGQNNGQRNNAGINDQVQNNDQEGGAKECPPDKVLNPKTNRCIDRNGKLGKEILKGKTNVEQVAVVPKTCADDEILNPKTNRCIKKSGVVGKKLVKELKEKEKEKTPVKSSPKKIKSKSPNRLQELHKLQMEAMRNRDVKRIRELQLEIEEERKKIKEQVKKTIPKFLEKCKDTSTNELPKLPTADGESDMADIIKDENHLIVIDNLCYDIKSLFDLIKADISQGNIWGLNPYVKSEGLILPFDKSVKETVLKTGIKRGILPKTTKWEKRGPADADDKEMRGFHVIQIKDTPSYWLQKGWASDGTAFPTNKYYAITFEFPKRRLRQTPGRTVIFPYTPQAEKFINTKLIPVWQAGALWSKKQSVTDMVEVINPNVHMVFEDNQPQRWYKDKIKNLEDEILKFAPAFT
jgi:hypothetical protein